MKIITSASLKLSKLILRLLFKSIDQKNLLSALCLLIIVIAFSSCYLNFYRTNTQTTIDKATFKSIQAAHKYFVVHIGNGVQGLENITLQDDTIRGLLVALPLEHTKHLSPKIDRNNRVKKKNKVDALMEVHLYSDHPIEPGTKQFVAAITEINRMDVYELNKGRTMANHIVSTVGFIAGGAYIASIIYLAIACNCPHVYVNNDGQEQFANGLYSGAIYSTLERSDYLPLPSLSTASGTAQFKISNAEKEEQFINYVQLLQVNHPAGTKLLADRHGKFLSYQKTVRPSQASAGKSHDVRSNLNEQDHQYFSFDNEKAESGFSSLVLTFKKPAALKKVKLLINARNSKWAGYVHEEFVSMFGESYSKWTERQEKADPRILNKWQTDQALPLMVYIKTKKAWKFVDFFPLVGNMASRDLIMGLEVPDADATEFTIKLETTFRFWDIDFAAIDYSENAEITSDIINPSKAIKTDGTDQTKILVEKDSLYSHLVNDESINFNYVLPASKLNASYFLISGGYYHNLRQYAGKANTLDLYKFRKKGAFDRYSRMKYSSLTKQMTALTKNVED